MEINVWLKNFEFLILTFKRYYFLLKFLLKIFLKYKINKIYIKDKIHFDSVFTNCYYSTT